MPGTIFQSIWTFKWILYTCCYFDYFDGTYSAAVIVQYWNQADVNQHRTKLPQNQTVRQLSFHGNRTVPFQVNGFIVIVMWPLSNAIRCSLNQSSFWPLRGPFAGRRPVGAGVVSPRWLHLVAQRGDELVDGDIGGASQRQADGGALQLRALHGVAVRVCQLRYVPTQLLPHTNNASWVLATTFDGNRYQPNRNGTRNAGLCLKPN